MRACLIAVMQQILEQYLLVRSSRLPTHWIYTIRFGSSKSEGRTMCPCVGPAELSILSTSARFTTLENSP